MIVACFICWAYNYNRTEEDKTQIQIQQMTLSNIMQQICIYQVVAQVQIFTCRP